MGTKNVVYGHKNVHSMDTKTYILWASKRAFYGSKNVHLTRRIKQTNLFLPKTNERTNVGRRLVVTPLQTAAISVTIALWRVTLAECYILV